MEATIDNQLKIESIALKNGALIIRAINHPLRQAMVRLLHEKGRMVVTELYQHMKLEQSLASQHLAILRNAGIVQTERKKKFIYYSVDYGRLEQVQEICAKMVVWKGAKIPNGMTSLTGFLTG